MPRYAAFLRAINTGGHRVKMDHLKSLFEEIGFGNVSTYIASGNVIFDTRQKKPKETEVKIEGHLRESLGYDVPTFVRTTGELGKIVDCKAFAETNKDTYGGKIYVAFLKKGPDAKSRKTILSLKSATDDFEFHDRELYWLCTTRMMESPFSSALLEKETGMPVTLRNMNTIRKMVRKFSA